MGVEFLQKTGRTIKVARDKDRCALASRDLFTRLIGLADHHETLRMASGVSLSPGDELNIECNGDQIVGVQQDRVVGVFEDAHQVLRDILATYGVVGGRVDEVLDSARVADIEIVE